MNFYPNFGAPDFLSPISGRILCDYNYVLLGNKQNIATPSPVLIDIRLDIEGLKQNLGNTDFVIGHAQSYLPKAQVLSLLNNGFMYNTAGVVSTKPGIDPGAIALTKGHILVGNDSNVATDTAFPAKKLATGDTDNTLKFVDNITLDQMAPLATNKLWSGNASGRPAEVDKIILSQMADLTTAKFWRGNDSNRPVEVTLSEAGAAPNDATYFIRTRDGLADDILPEAQALDALTFFPLHEFGGIAYIRGPLDPLGGTGSITLASGGLTPEVDDYVDPISFGIWESTVLALALLDATANAVAISAAALAAAVAALTAVINNLTLNGIADTTPTSGDVNFNNHKAINLADPTNPQDAVNLRTLNHYVASAGLVASSVVTAITSTPTQITIGATPNISSHNFTAGANSFIYTGTAAINALVFLVCQIDPDVAGDISIAFYVNGASFAGGVSEPYLTTNKNTVVVQAAVKLETNDTITIYGASSSSTSWSMYNINWNVQSLGVA